MRPIQGLVYLMKFSCITMQHKLSRKKKILKIISKVRFLRSTTTCDPAEGLILPLNGKAWLCDKPFTPTAAAKNTRCFLTCNNGFGVVQGEFDITYDALN